MTPEQSAAFLIAQSAVLMARVAGMTAENDQRRHQGSSMAYTEDDFLRLIDESCCHYNAAINTLVGN